jgi:murein L,D-transpeptidase YcbB/YkuD
LGWLTGLLFLRQRPGSKNALGLVKFIFPNASNVYMHGTPARALFGRPRRDFSHGCIRLEDPARLAEWVLRDDPRWTRARIEEAMAGEHPLRVNLPTPLTVLIFYDTVMIDADGLVLFADDYYRHDARLERALREPRRRGT